MISIHDTQEIATKLLISMGVAILVVIAILALDNLVIRDTPNMPDSKPTIEKSSKGNVGVPPVRVIPPIHQEKFYR